MIFPIKTKLLLIAKDDFPFEHIINRPIHTFIRKLIHGSHYECHKCYEDRKGIKVSSPPNQDK